MTDRQYKTILFYLWVLNGLVSIGVGIGISILIKI